jgi:hypothetical protein
MVLHKRGVYFWRLGSTWTSLISCPIALAIMSFSSFHAAGAPAFQGPILAGGILYLVALAYAIFHNYSATRSVTLTISTSMLQQVAALALRR